MDFKMQKPHIRQRSVCQQTAVLLWKNVMLKWRMRMQSFQEWFSTLALLFAIILWIILFINVGPPQEVPLAVLGKPLFNSTGLKIAYTPNSTFAKEIMDKIEKQSILNGVKTEVMEDEKSMEAAQVEDIELIGVVFQDEVSYRLRFPFYQMGSPNEYVLEMDYCYNISSFYCPNTSYWFGDFILLQSSIDSALIERITNHSVWEEMQSINGIRMRSPSFMPGNELKNCLLTLVLSLCFSPFMYFLAQTLSREKRKLKEVMKMMGLRDAAFWLSWGLLYGVYILILSCALAFLLKHFYFHLSNISTLFVLFFLYGISSICFCFMMSALLKKPKTTAFVVILFSLCFELLSITTTFKILPSALELIFHIFCTFAFGAGLLKILYFQKCGQSFSLSDIMAESFTLFLLFDIVLYMLLTFYFDKIVPDKYGLPYPPLFFLKKNYWFKSRKPDISDVPTNEQSRGNIFSENIEPVPPEFDGKEAIRLNDIKKTYQVQNTKTEALRGLSLDIYEGQITAILGHSGAGKTTLLNILGGFCKPTDGSATIFEYNIAERKDMEQIRQFSAVCPQFNIQFECLTVKENLKIFAKLKGIPFSDIENEVEKMETLLDISAIQNTQAKNLSGGQKRKLTLAITFLGQPQVLLLDEPTAGLDPYSRHQVWTLLNEQKAGRVILFTTQFMDEADILSDRKAIISHGRLNCVGSSLFLKKKWGIGYHLRMYINEICDSERTTSLVKHYIPTVKLSGQHENELRYILPSEHVNKFPDLFSEIDQQTDLGILDYGVTMTTLEDVFLKQEGNEKNSDYGVHYEGEGEEPGKDEMEQNLLLLSEMGKVTMKGLGLWRQQVYAIGRMHFLNLKRECKIWGALLLISGIILLPYIFETASFAVSLTMHYVELHPGLYFQSGKWHFKEKSELLILNNTGEKIDNFIQAVKNQNILVDVISGNNISDQLVHNGAIQVDIEDKKYGFTLMCHVEKTNCFPVLVNIISNAFLNMLNSTAHLRVWNQMFLGEFQNEHLPSYFLELQMLETFIFLPALPPQFAMMSMNDYKIKTHSQLWISGLFPSAYWFGQALIDVPLHCALVVLGLWPWILKLTIATTGNLSILCLLLVIFMLGYSTSVVLFLYVIAFIFRKNMHTTSFWSFILVLVSVISFVIAVSSELFISHLIYPFIALIPTFPVTSFLISFTMVLHYFYIPDDEIYNLYMKKIWMSALMPYIHSIILIFLLRYLELKYNRPVMRRDPVFRISPQRKRSHQNPEELSEENDRDVLDERRRAQSALTSANEEEKPVIIVHNLCKEYRYGKACSTPCFNREPRRKLATKNVSFCVKKGEILGLLGPNGAGKSTTISMIMGDVDPTAGQVWIKGADGAATEENAALGYCPQENVLWSSLTMKEHLEIFAAVKGIRKDDAIVAVDRISRVLDLEVHLKKTTKTLPAGLSRKLCFALSMLSNPTLWLLDEPTTGLDPKGKHQVWRAIHTMLQNKDEGAILTTHHMEEAETVCDRVAIMVAGQLRCLGSIQYLKSKFGKNYLLQIKVKGEEQGDLVNTQILKMFPQAARQERISTLLVYKIPMKDALPLSKAFSMLEKGFPRTLQRPRARLC
ncbi:ATP-binding cassette sub-family A member 6-like isoform X2 [Crotalus tigris]|uniref:ATP-binding cassette sub-family A member 6-like isoform X2 n=1 Tax=Crotalus tigris TaxID=88082 RepID=UPI00192F7317|nr:ATP-binding cassette sub-family A member 6-like isoform X2 [Crotalus tigris]